MSRPLRTVALAAGTFVALVGLGACGGGEDAAKTPSTAPSSTDPSRSTTTDDTGTTKGPTPTTSGGPGSTTPGGLDQAAFEAKLGMQTGPNGGLGSCVGAASWSEFTGAELDEIYRAESQDDLAPAVLARFKTILATCLQGDGATPGGVTQEGLARSIEVRAGLSRTEAACVADGLWKQVTPQDIDDLVRADRNADVDPAVREVFSDLIGTCKE